MCVYVVMCLPCYISHSILVITLVLCLVLQLQSTDKGEQEGEHQCEQSSWTKVNQNQYTLIKYLCMIEVFMFFRYFLVQKAKEAKTVGILVGTLGAGTLLMIYYSCAHVHIIQ